MKIRDRRLTTFGDWPNFGDDELPDLGILRWRDLRPTPASDWPDTTPRWYATLPQDPRRRRWQGSNRSRLPREWFSPGSIRVIGVNQGQCGRDGDSDLVNIAQLMQQDNLTEFEYNELRSRRVMLTLLAEMEGYDGPRALDTPYRGLRYRVEDRGGYRMRRFCKPLASSIPT